MKETIQFLYGYNYWANQRILDACEKLTQQEFLAGQGSSTAQPCIRDTLVHMMGAQEVWLARWSGRSPAANLNAQDFGTLALVRQYWDQIEAHTQGYLQRVEEDILCGEFEYTNFAGKPFKNLVWQTMLHQVNHATQHRSEVALLLTQLNHSPGDLDLIVYMRQIA